MKTLLPFLLLGLLVLTARAAEPGDQLPPAPQGKSIKLVWHDEFDGGKLDESKWIWKRSSQLTVTRAAPAVRALPFSHEEME